MSHSSHVARNAGISFSPSASLAIAIPSVISGVAVFFILAHVGVSAAAQVYRRIAHDAKGERMLISTPLGLYIVSLLFSTLLSSMGAGIGIQWIQSGKILAGTTCSAQAMILQLGSLSTAFFVLYISFHALNAAVLRRPVAKWVAYICVAALWFFVLFLDLAGPLFVPKDPRATFYGPSGSWCWIDAAYPKSQKVLLAVPMLIVAGVSAILFALIFARAARNNAVNIMGPAGSKSAVSKELKAKGQMLVAKYLMWYPIVYVLFNFPLAIVALVGKANSSMNGVVFAEVLYGFQGIAFAALFVFTYRVFGGRSWRLGVGSYTLQGGELGKASTESFEALEKALSPVTPKQQQQWKPAQKEWSAPLDRNPSMRSNRYSTFSSLASSAGPAPPMPVPVQPTIDEMEPTRDSASTLDTVVELPEAVTVTVLPVAPRSASQLNRMRTLPTQPGPAPRSDLNRQRSMAQQQPLASALSKRGFQVNPKPALGRKESTVRFANSPTVFNMSPIDTPISPDDDSRAAIPILMPARPPVAAMADFPAAPSPTRSPIRKPVPKVDAPAPITAPAPPPQGALPQPPVLAQLSLTPEFETMDPVPEPVTAAAPNPRKGLVPMIVIPGRPERHERDTVFVMETPVLLQGQRPFTEIDMPMPIIQALTESNEGLSVSPTQTQPSSPNASIRSYDSDDAASILLYYAAEPSPPLKSVSSVSGDDDLDIPKIAVQPSTASTLHDRTPVNPNPQKLYMQAAPGLLAPPPPSSRKPSSAKAPRVAPGPGYL
ncbi:hypothetical protein BKA62DRAFT_686830 [Auriculariales sp. MPI-PUGE-AT-0066]|nr:hypothetical protein BKA62DRAFT_686830 [Auriculariales sp. MPI-PUGE-AT-0066]